MYSIFAISQAEMKQWVNVIHYMAQKTNLTDVVVFTQFENADFRIALIHFLHTHN